MPTQTTWQRFQANLCACPELEFALDYSRMYFA
jgi:hypothetical protein